MKFPKRLMAVGVPVLAASALLAPGAHALTDAHWSINTGSFKEAYLTGGVYEEVSLRGDPLHDYMRWFTFGGSRYEACFIHRNNQTIERRMITTNGPDASYWYYDGPGYTAYVQAGPEGQGAKAVFGPPN